MIGARYWSTGITLKYARAGSGPDGERWGWGASLNFHDSGFADDDADAGRISTEGTLVTRYFVSDGTTIDGLTAAIDTLKADAERLGIEFPLATGQLYYAGDGEDPDWPPPPDWRELLQDHAERIGFVSPYPTEVSS